MPGLQPGQAAGDEMVAANKTAVPAPGLRGLFQAQRGLQQPNKRLGQCFAGGFQVVKVGATPHAQVITDRLFAIGGGMGAGTEKAAQVAQFQQEEVILVAFVTLFQAGVLHGRFQFIPRFGHGAIP